MKNYLLTWGVALAACAPFLATAQVSTTEPPKASAQLTYRSAFADYKPYKEAPLASWRELNDTVAGASGGESGHAGHSMGGMKGAEVPPTPDAPASAPVQMKRMPMHDGHPRKGGKP